MGALLVLYIASGLLLAALSVPLILRRIPPNGAYGFRVRQTMENPRLWYEVNAYAGRRLLVTGLGTLLSAILLAQLSWLTVDVYAMSELAVFLVLLGVTLIQSILYLRKSF